MVKSDQLVLNIHPQSELKCRADQDPNVPVSDFHEQLLSFCFGFGIMNVCDLCFRDTEVYESGFQFIIHIKSGFWRRYITENKLCCFGLPIPKINVRRILRTSCHLGRICKRRMGINQPQVKRCFPAVRCDFQHIVILAVDSAPAHIIGSLRDPIKICRKSGCLGNESVIVSVMHGNFRRIIHRMKIRNGRQQ